jgi:hypothetical protein
VNYARVKIHNAQPIPRRARGTSAIRRYCRTTSRKLSFEYSPHVAGFGIKFEDATFNSILALEEPRDQEFIRSLISDDTGGRSKPG